MRTNLPGYAQLQCLTLFLCGNYYDDWERVCARAELTFLTLNAVRLRRLTFVLAITVSRIDPWGESGLNPFWKRLNALITAGGFEGLTAASIACESHAYNMFLPTQVAVLRKRTEGAIKQLAWYAQRKLSTTHALRFFPRPADPTSSGDFRGVAFLRVNAIMSEFRGV